MTRVLMNTVSDAVDNGRLQTATALVATALSETADKKSIRASTLRVYGALLEALAWFERGVPAAQCELELILTRRELKARTRAVGLALQAPLPAMSMLAASRAQIDQTFEIMSVYLAKRQRFASVLEVMRRAEYVRGELSSMHMRLSGEQVRPQIA